MASSHRDVSYSSDLEATRVRSRAHSIQGRSAHREAETDSSEDERHPSQNTYFRDAKYSPRSSYDARSSMPSSGKVFVQPSRRFRIPRIRLKGHGPVKWSCWVLAMLLVLFVMSLVKMSWSNDDTLRSTLMTNKPAMWESFPFLPRYWGGIKTLTPYAENKPEYPKNKNEAQQSTKEKDASDVSASETEAHHKVIPDSIPFDPYPNYTTPEYQERYGEKVDCFLDDKRLRPPQLRVYEGRTARFPEPVMGDPKMLGMRHDICYDRFGRLGPYGLGYSLNKGGTGAMMGGDREGADLVWSAVPEVDYRELHWKDIQDRCFAANSHRFNSVSEPPYEQWRAMQMNGRLEKPLPTLEGSIKPSGREKLPRTAIVIRTWHGYEYSPEELLYLRSLITELSLNTGGEYTVHFLVQLKDPNGPIWNDQEAYNRYLHDALPPEFRGLGTLWTEPQMALIYPALEETFMRDLPVHGVYRSTFMPLQYFAYNHPEYDFFWNWEMDVRNTGHWYHLFDSVAKWAKKQPRKYLWERNSRFYIPIEHGSWEDFSQQARLQTERGTNSPNNAYSGLKAGGQLGGQPHVQGDRPIWGPERPENDDVAMDTDMEPPTSFEQDKYEWGVDEEADLITFNPLFDPDGTTWLLANDVTGYNQTNGYPPRRTAIITASRLSRKLLITMHRETAVKRHTMFSEMWPATAALHHGLKAVYVPHAEYIDRDWPTSYLESTFNAGRNGATGGARTSVFGEREHNFRGTTWYYNAGFPATLWHRWLGLKIHNDGGELFETAGEGRMCLPAMLLHPVKEVDLPQEGRRDGQ